MRSWPGSSPSRAASAPPSSTTSASLKGQGLEVALDAYLIEGRRTSLNLFANASYLWQR